jgi:hypothetical protein
VILTNAEHGAAVRSFAARLARLHREGDTAALAAIDAQHDALGYADARARGALGHVDAISACVPGPEVVGPYVTCVCGQRMPEGVWERHVELVAAPKSIHRDCLRDLGLPIDTPARQV